VPGSEFSLTLRFDSTGAAGSRDLRPALPIVLRF